MRLIKRGLSLLIILAFVISCAAIAASGASSGQANNQSSGNSDVRFTKKVVSVLMDNSGSMDAADHRNEYALYALQMLMALLGENDELVITPMNTGSLATTTPDAGYQVDLKASDREAAIRTALTQSFLAKTPSGGTPGATVEYAIDNLELRGLKDSQNLAYADENTEHWLVILTDGEFNECNKDVTDQFLEGYISDFPTLKTVFIAFGGGAADLSNSYLKNNYPFSAYLAARADDVVATMRELANQLCGRYTLDPADYSVSGSTITVDLEKAEFAYKSISVIAQKCGAKITGVEYNSQNIDPSQPCVIIPDISLGIANGYSAVINGNQFFSGGTLTIKFDNPLDKDFVSIMVEPALSIVSYVEYNDNGNWVVTDEQYINANLTKGKEVRVGYKVYEQATGKEIDVEKVFDDVTATVTYAKKPFEVGKPITLETGNNEIAISVSLMNGAYKMYSSIRCIIEENPTYYRVEAVVGDKITHFDPRSTAVYTVFSNNSPLSKAQLENDNYTWSVTVKSPDGTVTEYKPQASADGRITMEIEATPGLFGSYEVTFKVVSSYFISREHKHTLEYRSPQVTVESDGTESVTKDNLGARVSFTVSMDGERVPGNVLKTKYGNLTVTATQPDGSSQAVPHSISADGVITVSSSVAAHTYGKFSYKLELSDSYGVGGSCEHFIGYYPKTLEIKADNLDKIPAGETETDLKYTVYIDGSPMPKSEIEKYPWLLEVKAFDGTEVTTGAMVDADGSISAVLDLLDYDFGIYDLKFSISFSDEYTKDYTHSVSYYPESMTVTVKEGDNSSFTVHQLTVNESAIVFDIKLDGRPSTFLNRIISYKLTVGNLDVTQYAVAEGDTLIYVPKAEHLGALAEIGERTVTLTVECPDVPSISTGAATKFNVTKTVFVVESVNSGNNKTVDRFRLGKTDAKLYFRVLRDGISLSAEEIQQALDSGEISFKDKGGVFSSNVLLPAGREITVETVGGETLIVYSVKRDIMAPLDGFIAMFIFNGDKTVSAAYNDATADDSITFEKSPIWSYVWRAIVIYLVFRTLFCAIGPIVGKCNNINSGVLIAVTIGERDNREIATRMKRVNQSFKDKYLWHILRFVPFYSLIKYKKYVWYNQPDIKFGNATVLVDSEGNSKIKFRDIRNKCTIGGGGAAMLVWRNYVAAVNNPKNRKRARINMGGSILNSEMRSMTRVDPRALYERNTEVQLNGAFGANSRRTGKLSDLIVFVGSNN